jgi:D-sedoheptulose 7-phosphate isomerase
MADHLIRMTERYPELLACREQVAAAFALLAKAFGNGNKALFCGNGGSAADCEHIVGELMKGYLLPRPVPGGLRTALLAVAPEQGDYLADHLQGALPAISLVSQVGLMTAFANDVAPDMVFAQQVYGYGRPGDVVVGISTSGNSRNVVQALQVGRAAGLRTLGFTGRTGGQMGPFCDVLVAAPAEATAAVQEQQLAIYHALCAMLEEAFFKGKDEGDGAQT